MSSSSLNFERSVSNFADSAEFNGCDIWFEARSIGDLFALDPLTYTLLYYLTRAREDACPHVPRSESLQQAPPLGSVFPTVPSYRDRRAHPGVWRVRGCFWSAMRGS